MSLFPLIFYFLIGSILGSFTGAWAFRLIQDKSLSGRSVCESCSHKLGILDLVPILSFLFLRGRCRYCHKKISSKILLVELLMGTLTTLLLYSFVPTNFLTLPLFPLALLFLKILFSLFFEVILVVILLTDFQVGLIYDRITYPAIIISVVYLALYYGGLAGNFYLSVIQSPIKDLLISPQMNYLNQHLLEILQIPLFNIATGLLAALAFVILIIITAGRGMGWGDVKFVLFLGIVLGFPNILVGLFLSFLLGSIFSVFLIFFGKKKFGQTVPFGPFLSVGSFIAFLYGDQIINNYLQLVTR